MNTIARHFLLCGAIAALGILGATAWAQNTPGTRPADAAPAAEATAPGTPQPPTTAQSPDADAAGGATAGGNAASDTDDGPRPANDTSDADPPIVWTRDRARGPRGAQFRDQDEIVSVGGDSTLGSGGRADAVVSVFGSSTSAGDVRDSVVSVLGDTRVEEGTVGDSAVSVLGNNYVNAEVRGNVVAVLGNVELGPNANVRGNAVVVGGELIRDPRAVLGGSVQHVMRIPEDAIVGFKAWLKNCVRYLRPLAFAPGLAWAWTIALGVLALYALFAVVFRDALDRCVKTLEERPGQTIVASLLAMLLSPVLWVVLGITIIGAPFIPIVGFGMLLATLFGKAVVLAWIGRGVLKVANQSEGVHSAIAVLVGGVIVLLLYVVPVLGFLVFNLLGILGFGAVVYTLLLAARGRRQTAPPPAPGAGGRAPGTGPTPGGAGTANPSSTPAGATAYTAGFGSEVMAAEGRVVPGTGGPQDAGIFAETVSPRGFDDSAREESGSAAAGGPQSSAGFAGAGATPDSAGSADASAPLRSPGFGGADGTPDGASAEAGASQRSADFGAADSGPEGGSSAQPGGTSGGSTFAGGGGGPGAGPAYGGGSTVPPSNGTADALSLPRAGFWIRMLALLVDVVIISVVFNSLGHHTKLVLAALATYGAIMWKLKGTTVGGIVCNLKIVRVDGRDIDWSTAIVRALGCFLSLIVCGLGFIWIAFDADRQAWHDKIAGTAVVRVPQGVSLL